jgi:ketosteroid isomerase-like protein
MRCGAISVMRSGDMALVMYRWQASGRRRYGERV